MQYCHNLFPEYLRLQLDMLVIIHLYYSVCLAISRGNVVSLYLVSPISVLMKHVLPIYYLYLTYLYDLRRKALWVSHKYMLQQCMLLSDRNSVNIISVSMGLNSTVQ